jgi:hypothetical protein
MYSSKYPSLQEFLEKSALVPNQDLPRLVEGNLLSGGLKFQGFDEGSNLLFVSISDDSDCVAIDLERINVLKIDDKNIWYREVFNCRDVFST